MQLWSIDIFSTNPYPLYLKLAQRRFDKAESLLTEALEISHRTLGEDHPLTLTTVNDLATVNKEQANDEIDALLGKSSERDVPLTEVMGPHQFQTGFLVGGIWYHGSRWIGYFENSPAQPDGWVVQTSFDPGPPVVNDLSTLGDSGFQNGVDLWTHGAWINSTVPPSVIVPIDIKPGECPNLLKIKSKGLLHVAILGTEDFDPLIIDPDTISLASVSPIRGSLEDVATPVSDGAGECECTTEGPDGYLDLTLMFETQEIAAALGEVNDGDTLSLTLTGQLFDGISIEGADCVVIKLKKGKGKK